MIRRQYGAGGLSFRGSPNVWEYVVCATYSYGSRRPHSGSWPSKSKTKAQSETTFSFLRRWFGLYWVGDQRPIASFVAHSWWTWSQLASAGQDMWSLRRTRGLSFPAKRATGSQSRAGSTTGADVTAASGPPGRQ